MIRILLGQQGTLARAALARLLSDEEDLQVVAELSDIGEMFAIATRVRPGVVVLDHALPGRLAVSEACTRLCDVVPDCAVLTVLDRRSSATMLETIIRLAPRVGALTEDATPSEFITGIRQIAGGGPVLDARLTVEALNYANSPLTQRERDVLRRAGDGVPVKEIAAELFLSSGTVRNYLSNSIAKTGARTRIEAVRIAHDAGWI